MSLRQMLNKDPGFRAWVNGLLTALWLAVTALAVLLGWLSSAAFAALSLVCALTLTTLCVVAILRRRK